MTRENLTDFEREFEKQASRYYNYNGPDDFYAIRECCKELMQKAKEELMNGAVDAMVHLEAGANPVIEIGVGRFGLKVRDKVKLIIVKED